MTCFNPNIVMIQKNGIMKKNGEPGKKISQIIFANSPEFKGYEWYLKENQRLKMKHEEDILKYGDDIAEIQQWTMIPCQKCDGCLADQRKEWALRIELETKGYEHNYFLTLTYDDDHLTIPKTMYDPVMQCTHINWDMKADNVPEDMHSNWKGTLIPEDLTQFMKRLRSYFEYNYNYVNTKFYACGEYGEEGERPHYHIILMNCPELNLKPTGYNKLGKVTHRTEDKIEKMWGKGFIDIGYVNWDSISYVAGYTEKKLYGPKKSNFYRAGQLPIFARMSRRPGIGRAYFDEKWKEIYKNDEIIDSKGRPHKPPGYFDRLMDIGEKDVIEKLKEQRQQFAFDELKKKMSQTNLTIQEQLKVDEDRFKRKKLEYKAKRKANKMNI